MDPHDRDLLKKQLPRSSTARRNEGATILALVAVFLAGMTLGAVMSAYNGHRIQTAANDAVAAMSLPNNALPIAR
jgi:hypothetical protein